jgi:hypothetical protein
MASAISKADLSRLRCKYEAMKALRDLHARAKEDPSFHEPDPKVQLAALADAFPGALREIDELPIETIAERIAALAAAENDEVAIAPWMIVQTTFHRLARGALATKRWLNGRKDPTEEDRASFVCALDRGEVGHASDARYWIDALATIARPPDGRLMRVVWEHVALELDDRD